MEQMLAFMISFTVSAVSTVLGVIWFSERPNMPMPLALLLGVGCGGVAGFAAGTAATFIYRGLA